MNKKLIRLLAVGLISLASSGVIFLGTSPDNSNSQSHHSQTTFHAFPLQKVEFLSILSLFGLALCLRNNHLFKLQQWRQEESASEGQLVLSKVPINSERKTVHHLYF